MLELLVFALVFSFLLYWLLTPKHDSVPGPKGWPIFGNSLQLDMTRPHLKFESWAAEFGGLYKITLGGSIINVVSGYEELHQVLVSKGKDFSGRPNLFRSVYTDHYKSFTSMELTPQMRSLKKEVLHHVKLYGATRKYNEQLVINIANNMVNRFKESVEKPVNVRQIIQETITDVMSVLVLGRKANPDDLQAITTFIHLMSDGFTVGAAGSLLDAFPWLRFFGNKIYKLLIEYRRVQDVQYAKWKNEVSTDLEENPQKANFLAKLLQIMNSSNPFDYDNEHILYTVWSMFAGGISTTTSSLSSLFNLLVHNDDIQQRLHEESMQVLGDRQVKLADKQDMPYHMATVYEVLRYSSAAPFTMPHLTVCDTNIAGHSIPKGRQVWPNIWALHHDPKLWDDPYTFNPENYLNSSGGLVAADHPARKHMLAFGAGPRVCPGEVFALSRLFLLVASLVQKFDIKPATILDEQPSADCREPNLGLVLFPSDFKVRLIQRQMPQ